MKNRSVVIDNTGIYSNYLHDQILYTPSLNRIKEQFKNVYIILCFIDTMSMIDVNCQEK